MLPMSGCTAEKIKQNRESVTWHKAASCPVAEDSYHQNNCNGIFMCVTNCEALSPSGAMSTLRAGTAFPCSLPSAGYEVGAP